MFLSVVCRIAHELEDHLTGLIPCLTLLIVCKSNGSRDINANQINDCDMQEKINPACTLWKRTDKFLASWLLD